MIITWTTMATISFEKELDYINTRWTIREVTNFIDLVDLCISNLQLGYVLGKISKKTNIRSIVISKQTTLFFDYIEKNKEIRLLLFWNNSQNPKKLKTFLTNII